MRINAFFFSEVNLNQDLMLSEPQCQGVNLSKQGWVNLPERYRIPVELASTLPSKRDQGEDSPVLHPP